MNTVTTKRGNNRKGRPNYPQAFKRQLAIAACEPDTSVSRLALDHGLNASQVFKWRRDYLAGRLGKSDQAFLLPVCVPEELSPAETRPSSSAGDLDAVAAREVSSIEIEIGGALVRVNGAVDASQLRLVLRCLKTS